MEHFARHPAIKPSPAPSLDRRFAALEHALEHANAPHIVSLLEPLKDLLATSKLEQLHLLIQAEHVLSDSSEFTGNREDLLLGLINRLRILGHDDLLMTTFDRMSELLQEQGDYDGARACSARARQLRVVIFDEASNVNPLEKAGVRIQSSHAERDSLIPMRFDALNNVTLLGTLLEAHRALQSGLKYFKDENWQAAKGEFTTAAVLIDTPTATTGDGILLQAEAEIFLAACYLNTFEHELAIPYARHAVRIYAAYKSHKTAPNYRFALETLEQALSVGPENFEELQEIRKIIASFEE